MADTHTLPDAGNIRETLLPLIDLCSLRWRRVSGLFQASDGLARFLRCSGMGRYCRHIRIIGRASNYTCNIEKRGKPTINPRSICAEEFVNRCNIVHQRQASANGIGLVEFHCLGRLLAVEECCQGLLAYRSLLCREGEANGS